MIEGHTGRVVAPPRGESPGAGAMFKVQTKTQFGQDEGRIFFAAFESAPTGALLLHGVRERGAMILRANRAAREILGRETDELEGAWLTKSGILISTPEEFADALLIVERVLAGDQRPVTVERRFHRADGDTRLLRMAVAPLDPAYVGSIDGYAVHAVMHIEDITEQRQLELELQYRSGHDNLTGLMNRRRFTEELIQHLAEGRRYGEDGALLLIDIDCFKRINEDYGNDVGDEVLVKAAKRIRLCLRGSDYVARMGGDEFAVLMPNGGAAEAEKVADKLLGLFRGGEAPPANGADDDESGEKVSLSIGITPLDGSWPDPDAAYSAAYTAMRAAKAAGGDGIAIRHGRR